MPASSTSADAQLEKDRQEAQIQGAVETPGVEVFRRLALRPHGRSRAVSTGTPLLTATSARRTPTSNRLETLKQVVPSLLDVSSDSCLHKLSRSEPANDDRVLPLSSTTALMREVKVAAAAAECSPCKYRNGCRCQHERPQNRTRHDSTLPEISSIFRKSISSTNWSELGLL